MSHGTSPTREKIHEIIFEADTPAGKAFDVALMIFIILSVAAVLLELGKRTMGMYLQNAMSISQLYGSLGLIPLFMFWVYLMWLAVLFGLQVSSTLQHLRGRQLAELEARRGEPAIVDPAMVAVIMRRIAEEFTAGRATSIDQAADTTDLPHATVERIFDRLVRFSAC